MNTTCTINNHQSINPITTLEHLPEHSLKKAHPYKKVDKLRFQPKELQKANKITVIALYAIVGAGGFCFMLGAITSSVILLSPQLAIVVSVSSVACAVLGGYGLIFLLYNVIKHKLEKAYWDRVSNSSLVTYIKRYYALRSSKNDVLPLGGVCHGLSLLYGYYQFQGKRNEFFNRICEVSTINSTKLSNLHKKLYKDLNVKELQLEHFCNDVLFLHQIKRIRLEGSIQLVLEPLKAVSKKRKVQELHEVFAFTSIYTRDKYSSPIDTIEHIISKEQQTPKFIYLAGGLHAVSLFVDEKHVYYYDSNISREQVVQIDKGIREFFRKILVDFYKLYYNINENDRSMTGVDLCIRVIAPSVTLKDNLQPLKEQLIHQHSTFDISAENKKSFNKLTYAVLFSDEGYVRKLLSQGADPNTNNKNYSTLYTALEKGDLTIARLLLEHNADPNENFNGESLLGAAAKCGCHEAARLLLEFGANKDFISTDGKTPSVYAKENGDDELERLIRYYTKPLFKREGLRKNRLLSSVPPHQ